MAEHTAYEIGRLIQAIEDLGERDNTGPVGEAFDPPLEWNGVG